MSFYLSLLTLLIGLTVGGYFLILWSRHRKNRCIFLIFWAAGSFLLYIFRIPVIMADKGLKFVLTNFNPLFAVAFPATFLGLVLIYRGIALVGGGKSNKFFLALWTTASFLVFSFYFVVRGGIITSYWPTLAVGYLFFLPIHLLIIWALLKLYGKITAWPKNGPAKAGIVSLILAMVLGVVRDLAVASAILAYPPQFWFVAYLSLTYVFILQLISLLLLFAGFFLLHKNCLKYS